MVASRGCAGRGSRRRLELGGTDFVVLCTNTMHKVADDIQAGIGIPFLHIADATAEKIKAAGIGWVFWARGLRWSRISTGGGWSSAMGSR